MIINDLPRGNIEDVTISRCSFSVLVPCSHVLFGKLLLLLIL